MPAAKEAQTQKKPAATQKKSKTSAQKKAPAKPPKQPLKNSHKGFITLAAGLFALAVAFVPGESFWDSLQDGAWWLAGFGFVFWIPFLFYIASIWFRDEKAAAHKTELVGKAGLIVLFGAVLFLAASNTDDFNASAEMTFGDHVFHSFDDVAAKTAVELPQKMTRPGILGILLGTALGMLCGKLPAMIILILAFFCTCIVAFPRLRNALGEKITARLTAEKPSKTIPQPIPGDPPVTVEKSAKKKKDNHAPPSAMPPIEDQLAELDAVERGLTAPPPEQKKQSNAMDVLLNSLDIFGQLPAIPPAAPPPEEIARGVFPETAHRKKAQAAGDTLAKDLPTEQPQDNTQYKSPPLVCLSPPRNAGAQPERGEEDMIARKLLRTLESFGVSVELVGRSRGPAVTRYELTPAEGVKISRITALSDDIALHLAAKKVRIEAPIPGKPAVGVEIPNRVRAVVTLRELVESKSFVEMTQKSKLTVALGKDIVGNFICADLAKLPHLLIAGTTGSGKSVCMNGLILSLLYNASPDDVKMVMVDPKQVEFTIYSGIPHLLVPVVSDPLKAAGALGWAVNEMERRYTALSGQNVRDIDSYNVAAQKKEELEHFPRIVIFIDELSDLMMAAPSDVEDSIQRLAQKGRAAGIHLVVATQRPSVDVITGVIKSNLPGRIALSVASQIDSRTIINSAGAEQLLGNGDMLFSENGGNNALRVQGCYVSDAEVQRVVRFVGEQNQTDGTYDQEVWDEIERNAAMAGSGKRKGGALQSENEDGDDPMLVSAIEVVVDAQMASTTMLQKKLKLGYARASRLVDILEEKGVVGPPEGSKPRKVLLTKTQWLEYAAQTDGLPIDIRQKDADEV
ncbi:MAG: DNA translocase FtsK [Oscillospiraceae bacterium]|nr:DNA translocase FtsK [Oscillospiraceae bacterium]